MAQPRPSTSSWNRLDIADSDKFETADLLSYHDQSSASSNSETDVLVSTLDTILAVVASLGTSFIVNGFGFGLSVLYPEFIRTYDTSRSLASLIQSLNIGIVVGGVVLWNKPMLVYGIGKCIIAGSIIAAIGMFVAVFILNIWASIVLIGIVCAAGFAVLNTCPYFILNRLLTTYKTPVMSTIPIGASLGQFVYVTISELLLQQYGLSGTLLILAGTVLNTIPCALLLYVVCKHTSFQTDQSQVLNPELFRLQHWRVGILMVNSIVLGMALLSESKFLVDMAELKGYSRDVGALLVSYISLSNLAGRALGSSIKIYVRKYSIMQSCFIMMLNAASHAVIVYGDSYSGLVVGSVINGLSFGLLVSQIAVGLLEITPPHLFACSLAMSNLCGGASGLIGGYIGGVILDNTGSYDILFQLCIAVSLLMSVLYFIVAASITSCAVGNWNVNTYQRI